MAEKLHCVYPYWTPSTHPKEPAMAKGQQKSSKETKKPKKDSAPPKPLSPGFEPIRATVTTAIMPRGKAKNKPA